MLFNKDELINVSVGFVAGVGVTLIGEYIYKRVKEKKSEAKTKEAEKKLEDEAKMASKQEKLKKIVEEDDALIADIMERNGASKIEDDPDDFESITYPSGLRIETGPMLNVDFDENEITKLDVPDVRKHPIAELGDLLLKNGVYWLTEECYNLCLNSICGNKKQGTLWVDAITNRPGFTGWNLKSYVYLPSTGNFYESLPEWPSPEPLMDDEKAALLDTIGSINASVITNNYIESATRVELANDDDDSGKIWSWEPNVYLIDGREGQETLYVFKTMEMSTTEDDYIEDCKDFVDDPTDWYAQYGLVYGDFGEDDVQ